MRKLLLVVIVTCSIVMVSKSQMQGVMEYKAIPQSNQKSITYYGKYTLGADQKWYSDNFSLKIVSDQIIYKKDGGTKNFNAENQGIYSRKDNGIEFKYQKYYLPSKKIYMLISHKKEISHNNVSYYRIIIDGQTQLAL